MHDPDKTKVSISCCIWLLHVIFQYWIWYTPLLKAQALNLALLLKAQALNLTPFLKAQALNLAPFLKAQALNLAPFLKAQALNLALYLKSLGFKPDTDTIQLPYFQT